MLPVIVNHLPPEDKAIIPDTESVVKWVWVRHIIQVLRLQAEYRRPQLWCQR